MAKNWLSVHELASILHQDDLRVVDVRSSLQDPRYGEKAYASGHISGAIRLDLEQDLSAPKGIHGGRHPLPTPETLQATLAAKGIGSGHRVVAYDDAGGMFAARVWWILRYLGHEQVQLLDGGYPAWQAAGLPTDTFTPVYPVAKLNIKVQQHMLLSLADFKAEKDSSMVLDARAPERYRGEVEPLDPKAGHIPGAANMPFAQHVRDGKFKNIAELQELYAQVQHPIVYCGSGVSAGHSVLVLDELGIAARLYGGSYSDWVSYPEHEVHTIS